MAREEIIGPHRLPVWIYALCDPHSYEPRYIGKTGGYMVDRHKAHLWEARAGSRLPVHSWMRGVIEAGHRSVIKSIELVPAEGDWAARERHWIAHYRNAGVNLFNVTDGGEGHSGIVWDDARKERVAKALRKGAWFGCETCAKQFWRKPKDIKAGNNRFCSRQCYAASQAGVAKPVPQVCTERGVAAAAAARKSRTHCLRGHPLEGDNLFRTSAGARGCKECRKVHKATYRGRHNG